MVGDEEFTLESTPGVLLHLHVGAGPVPESFEAPFALSPFGLSVALYLEPKDSSFEARCVSEVRRARRFLGVSDLDPLAAFREFSLRATVSDDTARYNQVRVPRLALGGPAPEGIDAPLHAMTVFVAQARAVDGTLYEVSAA